MTKTTTLAKPEPEKALATVPAYLQGQGQKGLEQADQGDVTLPRLAIAQSGTPQCKKSSPKHIDGLEEGDLFNTLTGKVYGRKVKAIPVLFFKSAIKFKPKDDKGAPAGIDGMRPRVTDSTLADYLFGEDGAKPEWTLFRNFVCWLPEHKEMVVASMKSTSTKVAKQWIAFMRQANVPAYGKVYTITTIPEHRDQYDYFNFEIPFSQEFTPEQLFREADSLYNGMVGKDLKIDVEDLAAEENMDAEPAAF